MHWNKNNLLVMAAIAVILAANSMFQVLETEQVVITKFGKPVRIVSEPGLHFRIPFIHKLRVFRAPPAGLRQRAHGDFDPGQENTDCGQLCQMANF